MYLTSTTYEEFSTLGPVFLKLNHSLNISIYINDPEFDNEDNEYGEIKLHRYTNMKHRFDYGELAEKEDLEFRDEIVPLKKC